MVEPRFAAVRDAFATNFAHHDDVGAACAVYHRGRLVVDVWGGLADRTAGRPWTRDTLALGKCRISTKRAAIGLERRAVEVRPWSPHGLRAAL